MKILDPLSSICASRAFSRKAWSPGFFQAERLHRSGPGLAGAALDKGLIWNGNWRAEWPEKNEPQGRQLLSAFADGFSIDLEAKPTKAPVINGVARPVSGVAYRFRFDMDT